MDITQVAQTCPVLPHFDPLSQEFLADSYGELKRTEDQGPVFFSPVLDRWVVTGCAEIEQVLLDPVTFSAAEAQRTLYPLCDEAADILGDLGLMPTMSNADPPAHTRYRPVIMRALSPRRMAKLEPVIEERSADQQVRSAHSMIDFLAHCRDLVRSRRARAADDLASDLLADERQLSDEEASSLIFSLNQVELVEIGS
jgi:cytochrome P450